MRLWIRRLGAFGWLLLAAATAGCEMGSIDRETRFIVAELVEVAPELSPAERAAIARTMVEAARSRDLDTLLLLAVAEEESRYDPEARSRRGALGLMQLRPLTARAVADRHGIAWQHPDDLYEPSVNIRIGAAYLAELHQRFHSWELALTAYNYGPSRARRQQQRGRGPSSPYSRRVLARYQRLAERFDEP
jgi:soluble lytic murein transglycosylase